MRSGILFTILCTALCTVLLIHTASALQPTGMISDTRIDITEHTDRVAYGDLAQFNAQLLYANGTEMDIEYMDNLLIDTYVNGHKTYGLSQCDSTGNIKVYLRYQSGDNPSPYELVKGNNQVHFEFKGRDYYGLQPSRSQTYNVNAHNPDSSNSGSSSYMLDLISYAKGFFALSFFGALFGAVRLGCISQLSDDPQKKARSQSRLFNLGKILLTVTLLYMAVLFVAP